MNRNMEQGVRGLDSDWVAIGGYLSAAMQEVATDLGGETFAVHIDSLAASESVLPNPIALKTLETLHPGSNERVFNRMSEIQQEAQDLDIARSRRPKLRKFGNLILKGFASLRVY